MNDCRKSLNRVASLFHTDAAQPAGYRKHGLRWNKTHDSGSVFVIHFQGSMGNTTDDCRFTINLGVYLPLADLKGDKTASEPVITETMCTFRTRLGTLIDGTDTWWTINENVEDIAGDLAPLMFPNAEPWFTSYATPEQAIQTWKATMTDQVQLGIEEPIAILMARTGQYEEAEALLMRMLRFMQAERPLGEASLRQLAASVGVTLPD
jgi:hypothetical protein